MLPQGHSYLPGGASTSPKLTEGNKDYLGEPVQGWLTCVALLDLRRLLMALEFPGPVASCRTGEGSPFRGKGLRPQPGWALEKWVSIEECQVSRDAGPGPSVGPGHG